MGKQHGEPYSGPQWAFLRNQYMLDVPVDLRAAGQYGQVWEVLRDREELAYGLDMVAAHYIGTIVAPHLEDDEAVIVRPAREEMPPHCWN